MITVTDGILARPPGLGYDLDEFSLDTVKMFHRDGEAAGRALPRLTAALGRVALSAQAGSRGCPGRARSRGRRRGVPTPLGACTYSQQGARFISASVLNEMMRFPKGL